MQNIDKLVKSAMTALLAMVATHSTMAVSAEATNPSPEKCYGVVKSGMNDCATATSSCAGSSTKDSQADAFIFLPKGVCDKLVGGALKAGNK